MTPEPITPAPRPRWRRWRLGRWFIVVLLGFFGYGAWREYDFRAAVKEAEALGWEWRYDDPFEAIQKDWKAAFRKATWTDGERALSIPTAAEFEPHARLVRQLAPKFLFVGRGPELSDLSALKGLTALQELWLNDCTGLRNVDGLKGLPALQELYLRACTGLTNVDALKGLPALQELYLRACTGLTNVDALKGLPALQELDLSHCTGLTNADVLEGLPALQELNLTGCTGLTNVDALKGLLALQTLNLAGCTKLSAEAITALGAALPNTLINADH